MRKIFLNILLTVALILSPALSAMGAEGKAHLKDLWLRQGEDHVLLSALLVTGFEEEVKGALLGGVPLTLRYRMRLTRRGSFLGERVIRDREVTHTLEYDPVRQLYLFKAEGYDKKVQERTTKEEEEALAWVTTITDWPIYPLEGLDRRVRYRVRLMATLRSVELPSVLGYLFFFTSIFNQETPWVQVDFTY